MKRLLRVGGQTPQAALDLVEIWRYIKEQIRLTIVKRRAPAAFEHCFVQRIVGIC